MRITITVDADYTTPWKAEARLEFTSEPGNKDDTDNRINAEKRFIVETCLAAINSLDDIQQMPEGRSAHHREEVPEHDAILATRVTTMRRRHGLHLN